MKKNISLKKQAFCILVMICLCAILAAGCSTTVYAEAGRLSMPCPEGLSIESENKVIPSMVLPDTMEYRDNTMLANDEGSIVVVLAEVDDPQGLGIDELDAFWRETLLNPSSKDQITEMDNKFPGMGDMMENTVIQGPELLDLDGRHALMVSRTYRETSRDVVYCFEADGKVVGSIEVISSVAFFEDDQSFFDTMVRSVKIR